MSDLVSAFQHLFLIGGLIIPYDTAHRDRRHDRPDRDRPGPFASRIHDTARQIRRYDPEHKRPLEFAFADFRTRRRYRRETGDRQHIERDERDQRGHRYARSRDHRRDFVDTFFRRARKARRNTSRQRAERGDDVLFRDQTRYRRDCEYPARGVQLTAESERREQRLYQLTDRGEDRRIHALFAYVAPIPREVGQEPDDDGRGENDGERLFDEVFRLIPKMEHQAL